MPDSIKKHRRNFADVTGTAASREGSESPDSSRHEREHEHSITFARIFSKTIAGRSNVPRTARLIEVLVVELADLSPAFIEYNYATVTGSSQKQSPSVGKVLLLIFEKREFGIARNIFTDIQRWTGKVEDECRAAIGKTFDVIYSSEEDANGR